MITKGSNEAFIETRPEKTPDIIRQIVEQIDEIVKVTRFDGWQTSVSGPREVQKALIITLNKFGLGKDKELLINLMGTSRSIIDMNFIVIGNREWFKSEGKNVTYLKIDYWDDYDFCTQFSVKLFDDKGVGVELGDVKIGYQGQPKDTDFPTYKS